MNKYLGNIFPNDIIIFFFFYKVQLVELSGIKSSSNQK